MPVERYSHRLGRVIPMLDEEEYAPIRAALGERFTQIKVLRERIGASLEEARARTGAKALDLYELMTGIRFDDADLLMHVAAADYGPDCTQCGKPLHAPEAERCAECGARRA